MAPPFTWSLYVAIESVTETFKLLTSSSDHLSVLAHSWQSSLTPTRHMRPAHCVTLIQAHACAFDTLKALIPTMLTTTGGNGFLTVLSRS